MYRATLLGSDGFEKPVAIKVVESAIDDAEERLIDEARILGRLRHRAIPAVDGLVRLDGGMRALVLEYVDGADLSNVVRHAGKLPVGPLARLGGEIASALAFAWEAEGPSGPLRMVHRDIKSSNVMLTAAGDVKLLDFGIARGRLDRAARTQTGMIVGTARYMAPEAFAGKPGPQADVFALAITLLKLRKVVRSEPLGLLRGARFLGVRDGLIAKADLPDGFEELIRTMLQPDPERRPTAAEVARSLEELVDEIGGPGLRTWARQAWKRLPPPGGPSDDPNIGRVYEEVEPARPPRTSGRSGSALLGLGAGLGVSLVSIVAVAGVVVLLLVGAVGWWWWSAPLADVQLTPRAATSDANPEQGLAIDAAGRLYYVDGDHVVRDGETLPIEGASSVSTTADGSRLAVEIDGSVVLVDPDGGNRNELGPGAYPQLAPKGDLLAYLGENGLMVRDLTTSQERRVSGERTHGRWSPDGAMLAIPEPEGLALLDVATGERSILGIRPVDAAVSENRIWLRSIRGPADALSWVPRSDPWA